MSYRIHTAETPIDRSAFPADAIFFFDFDGVIASQTEEKVFRLPVACGERELLEDSARHFGIDHRIYPSTQYLRHLVFQEMAKDRRIVPHKPVVDFIISLQQEGSPFFVVTARSGFAAVQRMTGFLWSKMIEPQEVFCLGRSSKAQLLAELRTDWPDRPFVFFDDVKRHLDATKALNDPNMHIVEMQWDDDLSYAEYLRDAMWPNLRAGTARLSA